MLVLKGPKIEGKGRDELAEILIVEVPFNSGPS